MKNIIICFSVLMAICSSLKAQEMIFSAKQGISAARKAAIDSGYTNSRLVSIHTIWNFEEGTFKDTVEQGYSYKLWNGLAVKWNYTFYQLSDSSLHTFELSKSSDNEFNIALVNSLDESFMGIGTNEVMEDWIDSHELHDTLRKFASLGGEIKLTNVEDSSILPGNDSSIVLWIFEYQNHSAIFFVDALKGTYLATLFISVNEENTPLSFKLYPNPTSESLTISFPQNNSFKTTKLTFRDITGREIFLKEIDAFKDSYTFSLKEIPTGVYLLEVRSGNEVLTKQVSVIR